MIDPDELADLQALISGDEPGLLDDDPELADEAKATALLGVYGELCEERAAVLAVYEAYEMELQRRLEKLAERKADRLAPIDARMERLELWLENWHRAHLGVDRKGNATRVTFNLPTGTLKLRKQGPEIKVESAEHAMAWAREHAEGLVVEPPPKPQAPRLDGNLVRSFCIDALDNLPETPEPGSTWQPIPGVVVVVRDRKFTIEPDI